MRKKLFKNKILTTLQNIKKAEDNLESGCAERIIQRYYFYSNSNSHIK